MFNWQMRYRALPKIFMQMHNASKFLMNLIYNYFIILTSAFLAKLNVLIILRVPIGRKLFTPDR
jgi:hypothetical protein